MADRLRIVSRRWPLAPSVLADLAASPQGAQLSRDTFSLKFGETGQVLSASTSRWGGERIVGERRSNATLSVTLLVMGDPTAAVPEDSAIRRIGNVLETALAANVPDLAIEWRPDGATYSTFWPIRGAASYGVNYRWVEFASANLVPIDVSFPVAPAASGAPYDIFDDFSADTIGLGDWLWSGDSNTTVSVVGGSLVPSGVTDHGPYMRYRHARGYAYGDVEVGMTITTGSSVTGGVWSITLGADTGGADTMLELTLAASGISLNKVTAGSTVTLSTSAFTPLANTTYYFLLRRAGNVLYWRCSSTLNWTEWTVEPNSYVLTGSDLRFAKPGHVGFRIAPASTGERYDDFFARAFVYRDQKTPEHIQLVGPLVGDIAGEADIEVTPVVGGSTSPAMFGLVAWGERPQVANLCGAGNLTVINGNGGTYGWSKAAVAGVIGAGTSYVRGTATTPKYGGSDVQVVTPATTDTGANFLVSRRFKRGRVYAAIAWLYSASQTTNTRIKLGVSGDIATETAQALSASFKLHAVTWQPAADRDFAYFAMGVNAATITTFEASGVNIVESPAISLAAGINASVSALTPWYTPTDVPYLNPDGTLGAPFLALIDLELVRVNAINPTTGAWTIDRGQEGSTAATHSADALIVVLPPSRQQYEGKGAFPAFGIIEGEAFAADWSGSTPAVGNTDYRGGGYVTMLGSGAGFGGADFNIDPSSILPDDFADGDVLVEVWARIALDPAATQMAITPSVGPTEPYDPPTSLGTVAGPTRYTLEYGDAGLRQGVAFHAPSGSNGTLYPQWLKLGTLPMVSDRARPQRWRLHIGYSAAGGAGARLDYLMVMPIRNRASTPTGKASSDPYNLAFIPPGAAANAVTKVLLANGGGLIRVPRLAGYRQPDAFPDPGLGPEIDMPNTDCDLLLKMSNQVPNDPGGTGLEMFTAEPFWTAAVHMAYTPRFAALRGA